MFMLFILQSNTKTFILTKLFYEITLKFYLYNIFVLYSVMEMKEMLLNIVEQLFAFYTEKEGKSDVAMIDFIGFLNTNNAPDSLAMRRIDGEKAEWVKKDYRDSKSETAILFQLMYRYMKGYTKKALEGSLLSTSEEFTFLASLITHESMTKTELINEQVMEKTSGVEVIKRLINQGLIQEFADPGDKRSVRVSITDKGKAELITLLPKMRLISSFFIDPLNEVQQNTLSYLLKKLDHHHHEIFPARKNWSLDELTRE